MASAESFLEAMYADDTVLPRHMVHASLGVAYTCLFFQSHHRPMRWTHLLLQALPGGIVPVLSGIPMLGLRGWGRFGAQLQAANAEDVDDVSQAGFAGGSSVPHAQMGQQVAQAAL